MAWTQLRQHLPEDVANSTTDLCVIPIWPFFAEQIYRFEKRFEFRKTRPRLATKIFIIYETSPISSITGIFVTNEIISDTPNKLWELSQGRGGIDEKVFFRYYARCEKGTSISIDYAEKFQEAILLSTIECKPPQSYIYI